MITKSRHDHFFNHDSGVVIVDHGNLRIKEVAGVPCVCHKEVKITPSYGMTVGGGLFFVGAEPNLVSPLLQERKELW